MTAAEYESILKLTTDTPHLALTDQLWGVWLEGIGEKWSRYNDTTLYVHDRQRPRHLHSIWSPASWKCAEMLIYIREQMLCVQSKDGLHWLTDLDMLLNIRLKITDVPIMERY